MADKAVNPPFWSGNADADAAIQANWAAQRRQQAHIAATSQPPAMSFPPLWRRQPSPSLTVTSIIIPEGTASSGLLVKANSAVWNAIANALGNDWSLALQFAPRQWEEIVAGAFEKAGYDEVVLTSRSRDHGRDVIAIKRGIGSVKVLGSVKAYSPGRNVEYDDVRALMGVIGSERDTSKGIITTTSGFPPLIETDPLISPLLPTRLELIDGARLQQWLKDLAKA
jgi:restriction system protein